ncbi:MFS transporter [Bailinhaonella thermotolerans]|uniref:MFS transporter n=1 Tax=Bailinhaonella thermotolerans TaxID=1070861 RepID=A0A3A4BCL0_9ACTN|nr:MFS transporter [Bailinhaonella thermotolerans]RJL31938.1 MFS transporter [Bailinhaonella thermotolerans]
MSADDNGRPATAEAAPREDGPGAPAPSWGELLGPEHLGAAIVLAGGVLVGAVNIYLASSLLPTVVADIGGGGFYAWNMTVCLVAMVIATMLVSRFLGRFGNVGAYLLGFSVFLRGSVACALSPVMPALLAGRAVQGFGAGLLSGLGFAVIRAALPPRLWTRRNALMSAMYGVGNFAGPALGGLFAQFGSWRLAFGAMAAMAGVCGVLVPRVLPRGEVVGAREPVPVVSLLLVTAATAAVSLAGVLPGTAAMAGGVVVALLLMIVFIAHERRGERRVFPVAVYRADSPLKWIYLTLGLLAFGVAVESFVPLFAQRLGGLAPLAAGLFGAAVSLGWSLTQLVSSSATRRRTVRRLCVAGPLVLALGLLAHGLLQRQDTPLWLVIAWVPVLFAAGSGIGLAYPHLSVAAMTSVPDPEEGRRAAAAVATVTSLSIAFGTAIAGVLVNLGGDSMLDSARFVLFGFAIVCAAGVIAARRTAAAPASGGVSSSPRGPF